MSRSTVPRRPATLARRQGFTLVELMVALALGAIISVVISFISTSARRAYTKTVAKVDVYNRFRLAFKTLQSDLSNWIPTQELEFYNDGRGGKQRDFHWQPGEEVDDRRDSYGLGVVDGGIYGQYDEFAFIEQRQYESVERVQLEESVGDQQPKPHDAYRLYFKTMTYVDGAVREANVEYTLVDTSRPVDEWTNGVPPPPSSVKPADVQHLALYKIVRWYVINDETVTELNEYPIEREILELATNVTDFRVEYLVRNPFKPREGTPEFRTPEADYREPVEPATRPEQLPELGDRTGYRKIFGYGSMDLEKSYPRATAFSALWGDDQLRSQLGHQPVRFGFKQDPYISFAELGRGDTIYVFTPSTVGASGQGVQGLARLNSGDYTIKSNLNGLLEFYEDIDASSWGGKDQRPFNYKAAFVPSALRVTLRMVNDEGRNPKTMQQVVWLRRD